MIFRVSITLIGRGEKAVAINKRQKKPDVDGLSEHVLRKTGALNSVEIPSFDI